MKNLETPRKTGRVGRYGDLHAWSPEKTTENARGELNVSVLKSYLSLV